MNITSYNIGDVTFHYVALRVLQKLPSETEKAWQLELISQSIYGHVCSRSLRMMLPEPKGTYSTVGEKVCRELAHFGFVHTQKRQPYSLTKTGLEVLDLLEAKRYTELRRLMVQAHLETYDNLRAVFLFHLDGKPVWRPVVEEDRLGEKDYLLNLLSPSLGYRSASCVASTAEFGKGGKGGKGGKDKSAKSVENALTGEILTRLFDSLQMRTALFRTICDRLASLRLLNARRDTSNGCEFNKTYSPCRASRTEACSWYSPLEVSNGVKDGLTVYLSEPDMKASDCQDAVLNALDVGFQELPSHGGYHAIPELRDFVCERLMIPEPAFDEAVNALLDRPKAVLSAGLGYEMITAQRKPIIRKRSSTQLHNLLRRVK